jgi:excisionase family DNA binding protein
MEAVGIEIRPGTRAISVDQAMEALGISHGKIWDLIAKGELRTVKAGRRRLVPVAALDEFVA